MQQGKVIGINIHLGVALGDAPEFTPKKLEGDMASSFLKIPCRRGESRCAIRKMVNSCRQMWQAVMVPFQW